MAGADGVSTAGSTRSSGTAGASTAAEATTSASAAASSAEAAATKTAATSGRTTAEAAWRAAAFGAAFGAHATGAIGATELRRSFCRPAGVAAGEAAVEKKRFVVVAGFRGGRGRRGQEIWKRDDRFRVRLPGRTELERPLGGLRFGRLTLLGSRREAEHLNSEGPLSRGQGQFVPALFVGDGFEPLLSLISGNDGTGDRDTAGPDETGGLRLQGGGNQGEGKDQSHVAFVRSRPFSASFPWRGGRLRAAF